MKPERKISWNNELAISFLFFGPQVNYYIASFLVINDFPTITPLIYAVLYFIGLFSYLVTLRRKYALFTFMTFITLLLCSVLLNSEVKNYMLSDNFFTSSLPVLMSIYFPVFLLLLGRINFPKLMVYFKKLSIVTLIFSILAFYGYLFIYRNTPPDYMSFAYMMLTPILVCFMNGWKENTIPFVLSLIGIFITFIIGCRGAVVTIAVFFFLYILMFNVNSRKKNKLIINIVLLIVIAIVAIFAEEILTLIDYVLKDIGFISRTVNKLLTGGGAFIESEGRQIVWKQALNSISILGKGLFGDRTVIFDEYARAVYAHNIILEFLVDFGWLIGFMVVCLLLSYIYRAYRISRKTKDTTLNVMVIIMMSILLVKHMISTSFLTSFDFWFYFGFAVNIVLNKKYYIKEYTIQK